MAAKNNEAANLILKREPRAAEQVFHWTPIFK
jgi:hypothetical protein